MLLIFFTKMACSICKSIEHNRRTYPFNVEKDGNKLVQKVARIREGKVDKILIYIYQLLSM